MKDDNQLDLSSSSTTEQSKNSSSTTAPVTRRSISTCSVPNSAAEQEKEEKSRRYFLHSIQSDLQSLLDSRQCFQKIEIVVNHNRWPLFNFFLLKSNFPRIVFDHWFSLLDKDIYSNMKSPMKSLQNIINSFVVQLHSIQYQIIFNRIFIPAKNISEKTSI